MCPQILLQSVVSQMGIISLFLVLLIFLSIENECVNEKHENVGALRLFNLCQFN